MPFPSGLQIARKESELAREKEHLVELQQQEAAAREAQQDVQKELAKQVGYRTGQAAQSVCALHRGRVVAALSKRRPAIAAELSTSGCNCRRLHLVLAKQLGPWGPAACAWLLPGKRHWTEP